MNQLSLHNSSIQKFHKVAYWTAGRSVARFDHANVAPAIIAKAQKRSDARLCQSSARADGLEFGRRHLLDTPRFLALLVARGGFIGHDSAKALVITDDALRFPIVELAFGHDAHRRAIVEHNFKNFDHFILPCPVEHRSDVTAYRNTVPVRQVGKCVA